MKAFAWILGVALVFTAFVRLVWLRNSVVAEGYEVRRLRDDEADLRNEAAMHAARAAIRGTVDGLEKARVGHEMEDLAPPGKVIGAARAAE